MFTIETKHNDLAPYLLSMYKLSFFTSKRKKYYRKNGEISSWAIDLRIALSQSKFLQPIVEQIIIELKANNIKQVAGRGYGSFILIGAILARSDSMKAGLIRDERKQFGFRNIIEGDLESNVPTFIIDDVISSGNNIRISNKVLVQHNILNVGALCVFRYSWRNIIKIGNNFKIISLANLKKNSDTF